MQTIEQAAELHQAISENAPYPGGLSQRVTTAIGWATNQAGHSITFISRVAPTDVTGDAMESFLQGFCCVEINITAKWGGRHHDGTPRTGTDVSIHVLDRLAGPAQRTWDTHGVWGATPITPADVIPLLRSLLGQETLESIRLRKESEDAENANQNLAFSNIFGG